MIAASILLMSVSFSLCVLGSAYAQRQAPIMTCIAGATVFFVASFIVFLFGVAR